jgi:hypothetical protein
MILFYGAVAYAKIEFSPAEESGSQGCQIWRFPPKKCKCGALKGPVGNMAIFRGILKVSNKRVVLVKNMEWSCP